MTCKICGNATIGALGGYCSVCYMAFSPDCPQDLKDDAVLPPSLFGRPIVVSTDSHTFIGDLVFSDWRTPKPPTPIDDIEDELALYTWTN